MNPTATGSALCWIKLVRGQKYNFKEEGLLFDYDVPKEVPLSVFIALKPTGSFLRVNEDGTPYREDAIAIDPQSYKPLPLPGYSQAGNGGAFTTKDFSHLEGPPRTLKNSIGPDDDLNGKNILLRRFGGIGDVVFIAHVAQEVKSRWPKSRVTLAVSDECMEFAALFDAVDDVVSVNQSGDYAIVSQQDYIIPFHKVIEHNHDYQRDFFDAHWERIGFGSKAPTDLPLLKINRILLNDSTRREASRFLQQNGVGDFEYVVLMLGTTNPLKRYPFDYLKEVAEMLTRSTESRSGTYVVCLGSKSQIFDRMFKPLPECASKICSSLSLPLAVSAEIVRRARCVIGVDTGLVQFAASIGVPTVSLWGPIDPKFTTSHYTRTKQVVLHAHGSCQHLPCGTLNLARCPYYKADGTRCMKAIPPQAVADAVSQLQRFNVHPADALDTSELSIGGTSLRLAAREETQTTRVKVAVLLDNAHMHSGGGHYLWNNAMLMARDPELDVTVFTDSKQCVYEGRDTRAVVRLGAITRGKAEYHSIEGLDASYDVVVAGPPHLGELVTKWKRETNPNGVTALAVYETPGMIANHRAGLDTKEEFWAAYKQALHECDYVWCISKPVRDAFYDWDARFKDKKVTTADLVYPTVNSSMCDLIRGNMPLCDPKDRDDSVVVIGRNMQYKKMASAVALIAHNVLGPRALTTGRPHVLTVIGDGVAAMKNMLQPPANVTVEYLENVSEHDKWYKLRRAKCVIHPSDLEGFGIVVAEAMYAGTPVIVQALPEYVDSFSTFPIGYRTDEELTLYALNILSDWDDDSDNMREFIEQAHTFTNARYSELAIQKRMRNLFVHRKKLQLVKKVASDRASSDRVRIASEHLRVAVVTSWETQCGIAERTQQVENEYKCAYKIFAPREQPANLLKEDARVVRCWDRAFVATRELRDELLKFKPHVVHFHHEFSFYKDEGRFFALLADLKGLGIKTIVTAHTYMPSAYFDKLHAATDHVVFTKSHDGLPDNTSIIDLPVRQVKRMSPLDARRELRLSEKGFYVGTVGMWVPHKGYLEFLNTQDDVSLRSGADTRYVLAGYASPYTRYMSDIVTLHKARFDSGRAIRRCDFMSEDVLQKYASSCDVLVYNYNVNSHFSASAAVREGMAAGRPIVCSHSALFSEFEHEKHVLKVPFQDHDALVSAIVRLRSDPRLCAELVKNCDAYIERCGAEKIARQYSSLYLRLATDGHVDAL